MGQGFSFKRTLRSPDFYTTLIITFLNVYFLSASGSIESSHASQTKPQINKDNEVVYGTDDRQYVSNSSDPRYQDWAAATATLVNNIALSPAYGGFLTAIDAVKLKDGQEPVCEDEPYANDPIASYCTGFLVAEDVLVTAGHCQFSIFDCENTSWVFDFRRDLVVEGDDLYVDPETVYGCKEIIKQTYNHVTEIDFAVIRLDRPVTDREPLNVRTSGKVADGSELAMIGYPNGLAAIVADNAKVQNNNITDFPEHFLANLDSFKGNSGAPVINSVTGDVEGILVSGEDDWVFDEANQCVRVKKCPDNMNGCDGEKALRITVLADVLKDLLP